MEETRRLARAVNLLFERLRNLETTRKRLLANIIHEIGRPLEPYTWGSKRYRTAQTVIHSSTLNYGWDEYGNRWSAAPARGPLPSA